MKRRIAIIAGAFMLPLLLLISGCATNMLWDRAGTDQLSLYRVHGVRSHPGIPGGELIVSYAVGLEGSGKQFYEVPIDDRGHPPAPMEYRGSRRAFFAILDEIECDTADKLSRQRISATQQPLLETDGSKFGDFGSSSYGPQTGAGVPYAATARGLYVAGFRRTPEKLLEPVRAMLVKRDSGDDYVWPVDCIIVVLPLTQPRPSGDWLRSRAVALTLTPFTLAIDLVVAPYVIVVLVLGGGR